MQRLLPPLLLILTWVAMILLAVIWPLGEPFPIALRIIGAVVAALGVLIAAKGARVFRQVGTNVMTFGTPDKLVTTGLFAISRNPMYLGFAFCVVGGAVALGAVTSLFAAIIFSVIQDRWYVRFEEIAMREAFGADFEAYCSRVRRWL